MLSSLYIEFQNIERGVLNVELHRLCRATTGGGGRGLSIQDEIQFHKNIFKSNEKKVYIGKNISVAQSLSVSSLCSGWKFNGWRI